MDAWMPVGHAVMQSCSHVNCERRELSSKIEKVVNRVLGPVHLFNSKEFLLVLVVQTRITGRFFFKFYTIISV
jgi:hypothetical protein